MTNLRKQKLIKIKIMIKSMVFHKLRVNSKNWTLTRMVISLRVNTFHSILALLTIFLNRKINLILWKKKKRMLSSLKHHKKNGMKQSKLRKKFLKQRNRKLLNMLLQQQKNIRSHIWIKKFWSQKKEVLRKAKVQERESFPIVHLNITK